LPRSKGDTCEMLMANVRYLMAHGAPDVVFMMLEAAADAACDYVAWQEQLVEEEFSDEPCADDSD